MLRQRESDYKNRFIGWKGVFALVGRIAKNWMLLSLRRSYFICQRNKCEVIILSADILIFIIIVLFDCLNIMFSRDLLLGFLACQMNEKKARKLHASQSISSRIRMNYIKPYIKRNVKAFQVNY